MRHEDQPTAEEIVRRRGGKNGRMPCLPECGRNARNMDVSVRDGSYAPVLHCFYAPARCDHPRIRNQLIADGDLPPRRERGHSYTADERREIAETKQRLQTRRDNRDRLTLERVLYDLKRGVPLHDDPRATAYFVRHRGIPTLPTSLDLRFLDQRRHHDGGWHPTIVAALRNGADEVCAAHYIHLADRGRGKAKIDAPKITAGRMNDGAVRLAPAGPTLVLGEGIETTLSAMHLLGLPGWALLSAHRLGRVTLPEIVREVVIAVDIDRSGTGEREARRAAEQFADRGRRARLAFPPDGCCDWNDAIRAGAGR